VNVLVAVAVLKALDFFLNRSFFVDYLFDSFSNRSSIRHRFDGMYASYTPEATYSQPTSSIETYTYHDAHNDE